MVSAWFGQLAELQHRGIITGFVLITVRVCLIVLDTTFAAAAGQVVFSAKAVSHLSAARSAAARTVRHRDRTVRRRVYAGTKLRYR